MPEPTRREPTWFFLVWPALAVWVSWLSAAQMQRDGFSWALTGLVFVWGVTGGIWLAQTPPLRRLMAWRARKYGTVRQ